MRVKLSEGGVSPPPPPYRAGSWSIMTTSPFILLLVEKNFVRHMLRGEWVQEPEGREQHRHPPLPLPHPPIQEALTILEIPCSWPLVAPSLFLLVFLLSMLYRPVYVDFRESETNHKKSRIARCYSMITMQPLLSNCFRSFSIVENVNFLPFW